MIVGMEPKFQAVEKIRGGTFGIIPSKRVVFHHTPARLPIVPNRKVLKIALPPNASPRVDECWSCMSLGCLSLAVPDFFVFSKIYGSNLDELAVSKWNQGGISNESGCCRIAPPFTPRDAFVY
jgi:hypothetical protein